MYAVQHSLPQTGEGAWKIMVTNAIDTFSAFQLQGNEKTVVGFSGQFSRSKFRGVVWCLAPQTQFYYFRQRTM
jgi:hypothetical protein